MSDTGVFQSAKWICDEAFRTLEPRNVFRKERIKEPLPPHRDDLKNLHWLVRGTFDLASVPSDARLTITADDCYRLWINGAFVGIGPAPGFPQQYYCNTWKVGKWLRPGRNVIAVHVYYQGLLNRVGVSADYRQGLAAELTSGDRIISATDASWRAKRSEAYTVAGVIGYETQFMECFDSRRVERGWREADFDDSAWALVSVKESHDYTFVPQPTSPLSIYEAKPVVVRPIDGGLWLDFGREVVGGLKARALGKAGDAITLRFGEELLPDGRVRFAMRCNCKYEEKWILSGLDDELEQFDYKGFRYAEVLVPAGVSLDPDSIRVEMRHHPIGEEFSWSSAVPELDAIMELCRYSLQVGALDSLLDCPTREKGAYLGDATVSGHAHLLVSGDLAYARKSIQDYAQTAFICPGLMSVAPCAFMQEIADYSLQWPTQLLRYVQHSGDLEFAHRHAKTLKNLMFYFQKFARTDGLIEDVMDKWNLVDWPQNLRDGYDFPLTNPPQKGIHAVINAFWIAAIRDTNAVLALIGEGPFADERSVIAAFQHLFYRAETRLFVDAPGSKHSSLHTNVLALYAGAAPEESVPAIVELVRQKRLCCGVYMAYFVLLALARANAHDLMCELILDEGEHSWRNMLREGATTLYEAWGKEQKWNTSLCHPWASAPIPILIEEIVGVKPALPGWRAISFSPRIPHEWKHFSLKFPVASGEIVVTHDERGTRLTAPPGVAVREL